jgi:multisubunit Na+/H+ antiporter MnhF subunit
MQVLKLLNQETNLTTSSNVGGATLVRVFNNQNVQSALMIKDSTDTTILGSFTMAAYEIIYIQKISDQVLAASTGGTNVKVTKIGFAN